MNESPARRGALLRSAGVSAAYLISFYCLAKFSTLFALKAGDILWYGPAGLSLYWLLEFGLGYTPLVLLAEFLFSWYVTERGTPAAALAFHAASVAAVIAVSAAWLRRRLDLNWKRWSLREVTLLVIAILSAGLLTTGLTVASGVLFGRFPHHRMLNRILDWWSGYVLAALNLVPFLVVNVRPLLKALSQKLRNRQFHPRAFHFPIDSYRTAATVLPQAASIILTLWLVFSRPLGLSFARYLCFLSMIWIILTRNFPGATLSTLTFSLGALILFVPFQNVMDKGSFQFFVLTLTLSGLFLGILIRDRLRSIEERQKNLRESEERYRKLVDLAPDAIIIHSDETVVFLNSAAVRLLGAAGPEQIIGRSALAYVHPDSQPIVRKRWLQLTIEKAEVPLIEEKYLRFDGTTIDVEVAAIALTFAGRPSVQLIARDITARKRAEEELLRARKLESVGLLAGGIAHDFNNLLTAILGNLSLVETLAADRPELAAYLTGAEKASLRARDLTQQLLTFSKGGAPVRKPTSIADAIKESAGFSLSGTNVKCEFNFPDNLWPAEVDEGQISQVMSNLIVNAYQAMPQGGTIRVRAENMTLEPQAELHLRPGRYIQIEVNDQGVGIPHDALANIFDPYFTTKEKGRGLGLATVYSIVKNHEGHIEVKSEVGLGTTFRIFLPAADAKAVASSDSEHGVHSGQGRILVMDDEELVREVAADMLRHLGYIVETAAEGASGVARYRQASETGEPFAAVLMDLTVPGGMGGLEMLKALKALNPNVKAIVSSGYSNDPVMSGYRAFGFQGRIVKPYTIANFSRVFQEVLEKPKPA